jgi:hypothetical protein
MGTRATWIKGNTLGSPILLIEDNTHPFTEELGSAGLLWKWFADDKIDDKEKYLEDDRKERESFGSVAALTENEFILRSSFRTTRSMTKRSIWK